MSRDTVNARKAQTESAQNGDTPFNHLRVTIGNRVQSSNSIEDDGKVLVEQCLSQLANTPQFPPKLFILWATPSFRPYKDLLTAVCKTISSKNLGHVPLIGASVAVCLFDSDAQPEGALLICLASQRMEVTVAVGENARLNPTKAVAEVLGKLQITSEHDVNPRSNRFLIGFVPGYAEDADPGNYRATEIVEELRRQTYGSLRLFGGVASGTDTAPVGSQFTWDGVCADHMVCTDAIALALVTSDISYAIGMSHGLVPTGKSFTVTHLADNGRTIRAFDEGSPAQVVESLNNVTQPWVFSHTSSQGDQVVIVPHLIESAFRIQRSIPNGAKLDVVCPDPNKMAHSALKLEKWWMNSLRLSADRIVALLGIGCISRYRNKDSIGFKLNGALRSIKERYPDAVYAGCYMHGELGVDSYSEHSGLGNWCLSELLFADNTPARSDLYHGFAALAKYTHAATTERSLDEAMKRCLDCIETAGFPGCMISLVFDDGDRKRIVAQAARGNGWESAVKDRTNREFPGRDVLAQVADTRIPRFVRNAQTDIDCDRDTARAGKVISFIAIPLMGEDGETIALLQIGLGDMQKVSNLPEELTKLLIALGAMTAAALNRAILSEERRLAQRLNDLLIECLDKQRVEDAVSHFVNHASDLVGTEGHVRLIDSGSGRWPVLRLLAGSGSYFDASRLERLTIALTPDVDPSPIVRVAQAGLRFVVNDASADEATKAVLEMCCQSRLTRVYQALKDVGSFAYFAIAEPGKAAIGTLGFMSSRRWYFSQSRCRSLQNIGQQLSVLITHVREKEDRRRKVEEQQFLLGITPELNAAQNVHEALRSQAQRVLDASNARTVSIYLRDNMDRFVLRAQAGWKTEACVDAASYYENQGVVGKLLHEPIPYTRDFRSLDEHATNDRWIHHMFGRDLAPNETCEVIALPLDAHSELEGIVVLHGGPKRRADNEDSDFVTVNAIVLTQAAKVMSAFVSALRGHAFIRWHEQELDRRHQVVQRLLEHANNPLKVLLKTFCREAGSRYSCSLCRTLLSNEPFETSYLEALWMRKEADVDVLQHVRVTNADKQRLRDGKAIEVRCISDDNDPLDLLALKTHGVVKEVHLPVFIDGTASGLVSLHWSVKTRQSYANDDLCHHDLSDLEELVKRLAETVKNHSLRSSRERSREAAVRGVTAIGRALERSFHKLGGGIQKIKSAVESVRDNPSFKNGPHTAPDDKLSVQSACAETKELKELFKKIRDLGFTVARSKPERKRVDLLLVDRVNQARLNAPHVTFRLSEQVDVSCDMYVEQITECFDNVINNAISSFDTLGDSLEIGLHCDEKDCTVSFVDNGPGMNQQMVDKIQEGNIPEGLASGAGLGLFRTKLYLEIHGGSLKISSEPGNGTAIEMVIPLDSVVGDTPEETVVSAPIATQDISRRQPSMQVISGEVK